MSKPANMSNPPLAGAVDVVVVVVVVGVVGVVEVGAGAAEKSPQSSSFVDVAGAAVVLAGALPKSIQFPPTL